jgi:hypothetical protein
MDTKRFNLDATLTLIAAYLGLFVGLIDANAINLALPAIRDSLGGGISGAQWTIDVNNITFAAVLLTAGSLGDRHGRRTLSLREGTRAARLRTARTCYDHVAGRLGVAVMGCLLDREALVGGDGHDALSSPGHDVHYQLTETGRDFLTGVGVEMPTGKGLSCATAWMDGAAASSVRRARARRAGSLLSAGWVKQVPRGRALTVTDGGRSALADAFGIEWNA